MKIWKVLIESQNPQTCCRHTFFMSAQYYSYFILRNVLVEYYFELFFCPESQLQSRHARAARGRRWWKFTAAGRGRRAWWLTVWSQKDVIWYINPIDCQYHFIIFLTLDDHLFDMISGFRILDSIIDRIMLHTWCLTFESLALLQEICSNPTIRVSIFFASPGSEGW